MCAYIPLSAGAVAATRQSPNPPDRPPDSGEQCCHECGKSQKMHVRSDVRPVQKSDRVSVPCPFVRQADDIRELKRVGIKLSWIAWLLLVSCFVAPFLGSADAKVCQSVDVRNTPDGLKNLIDCEVVEGYVQILLIENANASAYAAYSFPKLREITDYLLLYRAFNLETLVGLFPNLRVIQGQNLFSSFALVIWEMHEMKEIGLANLTDIRRGSVRIEKNDNLCFANTIDWDHIAPGGVGGHVIKGNKDPNACGGCPSRCYTPADKKPRCWTPQHCQIEPCKACPDSRSCFNKTDGHSGCCNSECVGGCSGPDNDECFVCKNVRNGNECVRNCPDGKYEFRSRRCISMTECINEFVEPPSCGKARRYIPFQGKCLAECPAGFQEMNETDAYGNVTHQTCKKCTGDCPKECNAVYVNSLATIQQLKGCTKINGALEINLNGANNIVRELEENLKSIEVVRDYVKIVRSYPLVDLTFLVNLREIRGENLDQGNALIIRDNENLQELFGNTTQLRIFNGKFSFSFNPWLCYSKILELSKRLNMTEPLESDVSKWTNGQKASCHNEKLEVKVSEVSELSVIFFVQNFLLHERLADRRQLIGYEYHYREAVEANVTIFGGRDACGNDGWITGEMEAEANDTAYETKLISHLKPFTQYAFYFNTYMVVNRPDLVGNDTLTGATSDVIYVRTLSGQPSPPIALTVTANSSTEMYISWKSPFVPNANITFYYVQVQIIYDDGDQLKERDYCEKRLEAIPVPDKKTTAEEKTRPPSGGDCCSSCPVQGKQTNLREGEDSQKDSIDFENNLHNTVYVKRESSSCSFITDEEFPGLRRRRDVSSRYSREVKEVLNFPESRPASKFTPPFNTTTTTTELGELVSFESRVSDMSAIVRKLRHFSNYRVTVRACRDDEEHRGANFSSEQCSIAQYETVRTKPVDNADSINSSTVVVRHESNGTVNDIVVEWERPANPNGLIVSYDLELTLEATDSRSSSRCISVSSVRGSNDTRETFREKNLPPGKWKVRLWATSLSGAGPKTEYKEVEVPEQPSNYLGFIIGSVVVFLFFVVGFVVWYRRKGDDIPKAVISSVNPDYPFLENSAYIPDEYEVCREYVQLIRELGQGSFGMVYEGILRGSIRNNASNEEMRCAVKTVNEGASVRERIEFLNEASVMKSFHCNHVVKLLGVVSKGQPTYVIMELMVNGDLKSFLRSLRPDTENSNSGASQRQPPTLKCILRMAAEIADGMAYLAAKKFVHRDLAARNCMVSEELTVKIGDFGMTRDIYETDYYRKGGKGLLPVRWMSPESLKDGLFSSHSDVWSFGVVLWEMATLASQPYQGLSNEQVLKYVMEGGKMDMPDGCPEILYDLMLQCWRFHAKQRPRFVEIVELLMPEVNDEHFPEVSFYHSSEGQEFRQTERQDHSVLEEVQEESDYGEDIPLQTFGSTFRMAERGEKERSYVPDQTAVEILDIDCPEDDDVLMSESHDEEEPLSPDRDSRDHAPLTYPGQNRRPFIEHRNGNSQLPSSESSKTASDSSKSGSHLSNGSVTNGYVNRRDNAPAQC